MYAFQERLPFCSLDHHYQLKLNAFLYFDYIDSSARIVCYSRDNIEASPQSMISHLQCRNVHRMSGGSFRLRVLASFDKARASPPYNGDENVALVHGCYKAWPCQEWSCKKTDGSGSNYRQYCEKHTVSGTGTLLEAAKTPWQKHPSDMTREEIDSVVDRRNGGWIESGGHGGDRP